MNAPIALGGVALVGGAIVSTYALLRISTRPVTGQALTPDVAVALVIAAALLLLGFPALYAVQADAGGVVALVGQALLSTGLVGFSLGSTATAMANMQAVAKQFGPSPQAFLIVPVVGAFFIDLMNALVLTGFLSIPLFSP